MTAATPALAAASGRSAIATAYALFVRRELFTRRSLLLTLVCLLPAVVAGTARAFGKGGYGFFEQTAGGIYLTVLSVVV
ncbi:MAG TPA: hypothetical protein VKE69_07160, partial [Planctomycetota bacterium]|nr:hypothetical protein [Planctomycetota bacterium]